MDNHNFFAFLACIIYGIFCAFALAIPKCEQDVTICNNKLVPANWCSLPVEGIIRFMYYQGDSVLCRIICGLCINSLCTARYDYGRDKVHVFTDIYLFGISTANNGQFFPFQFHTKNNNCNFATARQIGRGNFPSVWNFVSLNGDFETHSYFPNPENNSKVHVLRILAGFFLLPFKRFGFLFCNHLHLITIQRSRYFLKWVKGYWPFFRKKFSFYIEAT